LIRSFLAIELPQTVVKRIEEVQGNLKSSHADVRWANPHQIHLTLKFFGNIEESKVDSILTSIQEPVRETPPFLLEIRGVGAFPHPKNPRVIWMGLVDGENVLHLFHERLENSLEQVGFEPEDRPFHPHLTLGRVKSGREKGDLIGRMESYREQPFGDFQVERVLLFKSDLKPTGPIYTPLREMRLGT
jgi:2'-5' RNA ligase